MKRYEIIWTYLEDGRIDDGKDIVRAVSPSDAERRFYRRNRPVWVTCDCRGYCVNSIREV